MGGDRESEDLNLVGSCQDSAVVLSLRLLSELSARRPVRTSAKGQRRVKSIIQNQVQSTFHIFCTLIPAQVRLVCGAPAMGPVGNKPKHRLIRFSDLAKTNGDTMGRKGVASKARAAPATPAAATLANEEGADNGEEKPAGGVMLDLIKELYPTGSEAAKSGLTVTEILAILKTR